MKIKQLKNKQIIPYQDSAFCSTLHCPLYSALSLLKNIPTTATITIGMSECAFYSTKGIELDQGAHYNYVLDENELIFGYEEALKQAIQELMTEGYSKILLLNTCVPAFLDFDLKGMIDSFNQEKCQVQLIDLAYIHSPSSITGYEKIYEALIQFEPDQPITSQVNILGHANGEEYQILMDTLSKAYDLCFFDENHIENVSKLKQGCLNIVFSSLYHSMTSHFKQPTIYFYEGYNEDKIKGLYQQIEQILSITIPVSFRKIDYPQLLGKSSSFIHHQDISVLLLILEQMNLSLEQVHLESFSKEDRQWILQLQSNPEVVYSIETNEDNDTLVINNQIFYAYEIVPLLNLIGYERIEAIVQLIGKEDKHATL